MNKQTFVIPRQGITSGEQKVRAIYSETSAGMLKGVGTVSNRRASNVEPGSGLSQAALRLLSADYVTEKDGKFEINPEFAACWFADMTPCGGDVVLGPYDIGSRQQALDAEVAWLLEHHLPAPG